MAIAATATAILATSTAAFANTTNPTATTAVGVVNVNGTETVTVSGSWTWPRGQECVQRYATGWSIGWWGVGSTPVTTNDFTLTNATLILNPSQGQNGVAPPTGSIISTGGIRFPSGGASAGQYFYVGTALSGQEIFTPTFCNAAQPPNGTSTAPFSGTFSASATYPSPRDDPAQICVNTFDVHGSQGKPGNAANYVPLADSDNSIQWKQFDPKLDCSAIATPTLSVTKQADAVTVSAGTSIGFTISVASTSGPTAGTVDGVSLQDPLPSGSGVNWSISPAYSGPGTCSIVGSAAAQRLSCTVGNLAPGKGASVHLSSATNATSAGTYQNTVTASATNAASKQASASTTVLAPSLSITKTADGSSVSAGSPIGFTIKVSNAAGSSVGSATGVSISDPLPAGSGVRWAIDPGYGGPGSCSINGLAPAQSLSCSIGTLAPGASASVHVTSDTTGASAGTYSNTAALSATNAPSMQASASTSVLAPGLNITKTADESSVSAGSPIGFTIDVSNASGTTVGTAREVTLSDPLPAGTGTHWSISPVYSGPGGCSIVGVVPTQAVSCAFGDIAPGVSASVHVATATTAASAGTYANTATVSASNSPSLQASATTTVRAPALVLTKTADATRVSTGSPIGFTILIANAAGTTAGTATAVTLSDPLPGGTGINWSISPGYSGPGSCSITGSAPKQAVSCMFGDMAPSTSTAVHLRSLTTEASAGTYDNTATASATNSTTLHASAGVAVIAPSLRLAKTADAPSAIPGSPIGYTITVSNGGGAGASVGMATGVTLSDPLPGGTGIVWSISPSYRGPGNCSISGSVPRQTLSCSIGNIASGASVAVHVSSPTSPASVGTYRNTATASGTNAPSVSASAATTVAPPTLTLYLGYADGFRTAPHTTPGSPWEGSPYTTFVGCPGDRCTNGVSVYDGGALMISNPSSSALALSSARVVIGGCTFSPWGSRTIPPAAGSTRGSLILTETVGPAPQTSQKSCVSGVAPTVGDDFDTSDTAPGRCSQETRNDGLVPQISIVVGGQTWTFTDKAQILNTGGKDRGCTANETTPWTAVGSFTIAPPKKVSASKYSDHLRRTGQRLSARVDTLPPRSRELTESHSAERRVHRS